MIYPDVTLEEWLKRYPDLKVVTGICDGCGGPKPTIKPFRFKHGVGLECLPCSCGKGRHSSSTMLITETKEIEKWREILGSF